MRVALPLSLIATGFVLVAMTLPALRESPVAQHPFLQPRVEMQTAAGTLAYSGYWGDEDEDDDEEIIDGRDVIFDELDRPYVLAPEPVLLSWEPYPWYAESMYGDLGTPYYVEGPVYLEPVDIYVEQYIEVIEVIEEPWYERTLPGIGSSLSYILPPVWRTVDIAQPAAPLQRSPQPSCSLNAQPSQVNYGSGTVLSWHSNNATQAHLGGVGAVPTSGTHVENGLTISRMFSVTVSGPGGVGACYTTVAVAPSATATPSCIISAYPDVIQRGETANLAWGSENTAYATLSGYGAVGQSGGRVIAPDSSTTFTLVVYSNSGTSRSCSATITVR